MNQGIIFSILFDIVDLVYIDKSDEQIK